MKKSHKSLALQRVAKERQDDVSRKIKRSFHENSRKKKKYSRIILQKKRLAAYKRGCPSEITPHFSRSQFPFRSPSFQFPFPLKPWVSEDVFLTPKWHFLPTLAQQNTRQIHHVEGIVTEQSKNNDMNQSHGSNQIKHLFNVSRKELWENHCSLLLWKSRFTRKKMPFHCSRVKKRPYQGTRKYPWQSSMQIASYYKGFSKLNNLRFCILQLKSTKENKIAGDDIFAPLFLRCRFAG